MNLVRWIIELHRTLSGAWHSVATITEPDNPHRDAAATSDTTRGLEAVRRWIRMAYPIMAATQSVDGTSWLYGCHAHNTVPENAVTTELCAPTILTRCS